MLPEAKIMCMTAKSAAYGARLKKIISELRVNNDILRSLAIRLGCAEKPVIPQELEPTTGDDYPILFEVLGFEVNEQYRLVSALNEKL